jgi:hypothetical protein
MFHVTPQAWGAPSHKGLLMTLIPLTRTLSVVAALYVAAWATGLMLVWTDGDPRLVGFGLGLMAPGGGLAFYGHWPELAAILASAALAGWKREFAILAILGFAWFVVAAISLTHGPHPGMGWSAARWVVPAVTVLPALISLRVLLATFHRRYSISAR